MIREPGLHEDRTAVEYTHLHSRIRIQRPLVVLVAFVVVVAGAGCAYGSGGRSIGPGREFIHRPGTQIHPEALPLQQVVAQVQGDSHIVY